MGCPSGNKIIAGRLRYLLATSSFAALLLGGGIANSGTISACNIGIQIGLKTGGGMLFGVTSFGGNVSNSGTITAKTGISIVGSTINGAIVDSGTLTASAHGILIDNASKIVSTVTAIKITGATFTGGISNAGVVSGHALCRRRVSGLPYAELQRDRSDRRRLRVVV